jgi:hypothetical protein
VRVRELLQLSAGRGPLRPRPRASLALETLSTPQAINFDEIYVMNADGSGAEAGAQRAARRPPNLVTRQWKLVFVHGLGHHRPTIEAVSEEASLDEPTSIGPA